MTTNLATVDESATLDEALECMNQQQTAGTCPSCAESWQWVSYPCAI